MRARAGAAAAVGALLLGAACGRSDAPPAAPVRACGLTVWYKPASDASSVEIVGDYDGWARPGKIVAADRADGWRVASLDVAPGEHTYAIVDDGVWLTDPNVGTTAFHDGHEVTWVDVASCDAPALRVTGASGTADGHARITGNFLASRAGGALDPASIRATTRDGAPLAVTRADPASGAFELAADGLAPGKYTVTLHAKDARGRDADDAVATVWIGPNAPGALELRDLVMYQLIVDRYRGDAGPLATPAVPSARAGGTLRGVTGAITRGDFDALGVNALWLSPLYANPAGTFPGSDGRPYTGYHGYWPDSPRALAPELGTEDDLDALVRAAHARGIRVVFDVVPNHVHQAHPYYAQHPDWFDGSPACVCGSSACSWSEHIQDCWFAPYLPDVDWTNPAAADQMTSDVRWWLDRFDGDGVRIDAVPMMPRAATRRIAQAIRARYDQPGHASIVLGENFTGPGGYSQIRYELGPFGLNSEFHFPLMWALRGAIAAENGSMRDVDAALLAGQASWDGSGATMATMIGNHDVTRFASESAGDASGDGWTAAPQPADPLVYEKQAMALAVVMTVPGLPVIYYGDDVALAGRGDPDSRRVMPADGALSDAQRAVRDTVSRLARVRACAVSLRRGAYRTLYADDEALVFAREADGAEPVVVALLRRPAADVAVPLPGVPAGDYVDPLSGGKTSLFPELTNMGRAPFSVRVLVPAGSACAAPR